MTTLRTGGFLTLTLALLVGCDANKPRAPVLATEAVYTNDTIGLTLVAPDGWNLYAKAHLPPGTVFDRPIRLAAYERTDGKVRADLELYAIERGDEPLLTYLVKKPIGPDKWAEKGSPEAVTINGVKADRYSQSGSRGRADMRREITAFERAHRTYIFILTHEASDTKHREQSRRAIETATWK
jgi:hypothetical protein